MLLTLSIAFLYNNNDIYTLAHLLRHLALFQEDLCIELNTSKVCTCHTKPQCKSTQSQHKGYINLSSILV